MLRLLRRPLLHSRTWAWTTFEMACSLPVSLLALALPDTFGKPAVVMLYSRALRASKGAIFPLTLSMPPVPCCHPPSLPACSYETGSHLRMLSRYNYSEVQRGRQRRPRLFRRASSKQIYNVFGGRNIAGNEPGHVSPGIIHCGLGKQCGAVKRRLSRDRRRVDATTDGGGLRIRR
jgi:hypothetical protein